MLVSRLAAVAGALVLCAFLDAADLQVSILQGQGAINGIRDRTGKDLSVKVERNGLPVSGAVVTFVLPEIGPGGYFPGGVASAIVHSGSDGVATVRGLRANNVAGDFHIRVTASDSGDTVTTQIDQSNVAPAQGGSQAKKIIIIGAIAGAVAGGALAASRGGSKTATAAPAPGSSTPTPTPGAVITPGTPSFGPPR